MRLTTCFLASLLLATPALAQSPSGNVGQPERSVPQAGGTTSGPIDNPSTRGMAPTGGPAAAPTGGGAMSPDKGGNASDPTRGAPNTGTTSGGPAR